MNSATVFFALAAVVVSASASVTPVTQEQQQQQVVQQQQQQQQQQLAQASAMQQVNVVPIDVYARTAYRQAYAIADDQKNADGSDQKASYSIVPSDGQLRAVNYIANPYNQYQAQILNQGLAVQPIAVAAPLGLGARLGGSIHISPAARGFALGGITGLGVGLASRGLLAGSLAGPIGLGLHGAFSGPALGVGALGAGAAALLG